MGSYRTIMDPNRVQGSTYNLTFDEVENQLGNTNNNVNTGKSHHNMNFDELLKNVISAESVQNPTSSFFIGSTSNSTNGGFNGTTLSTNNSNSNKTFNEVWMEINNNQKHVTTTAHSLDTNNLGFLARGAAINNHDNHVTGGNVAPLLPPPKQLMPMVMDSQPQDWFPPQMPMSMSMQMVCPNFHQQQQQQQHDFKSVYENQVMEIGYTVPMPMMEATMSSSDFKGGVGVGRKHRYSDEMLEQNIERKKKRMAKNRESAARSRAKKQEHINKLQVKKFTLETENRRLKKNKALNEDQYFFMRGLFHVFL